MTLKEFRDSHKLLTSKRAIKKFCDANIGEGCFEDGYPSEIHTYAKYYYLQEITSGPQKGLFFADFANSHLTGTKAEVEVFVYDGIVEHDEMEITLETLPYWGIYSVEDVKRFFEWLRDDQKLSFHIDIPFTDYMNRSTRKLKYSPAEASLLQDKLATAYSVCEDAFVDIYEIAKALWKPETPNT